MRSEYRGELLAVRAVEDCIRATRKYTKGAFSRRSTAPIQGDNFPSKVLTEYYEVYPELEISWDMPARQAIDWLWGDYVHIDVRFRYDYREGKAEVIIYGGQRAIEDLAKGIPGFKDYLDKVTESYERQPVQMVAGTDRVRVSPFTRPQ